ncbi:hypothetical protein EYB25_007963 [Talaromyces marneffei]|nr:hypothetical protein EYB25_007963 [Talaromyces marneffei]
MADFLDPSSISPNISSLGQDDDPVKLFRCWIRQSCDDCISMRDDLDCSWCPFSSTCVPNPTDKYPLLAPIDYPDICPLGAKERWELRARGLGCNVSTRNFLSVVVAVVSSFMLVGLMALIFHVLSKMIGWCMERRRSRSRRGGRRSHLGIIFYRGMDGGRVDIIEDETGHRRERMSHDDGAFINETSPLLRANNQGMDA